MPQRNQTAPNQPRGEVRGEVQRDARGRWLKGASPNPKGRPPKKIFKDYSPSDVRHFANTQIELTVNGQPEKMDRRAALLSKTFESAMSGKVSQQRFLMNLFEKSDANLAELRNRFDQLLNAWMLDNPEFKAVDESLTSAQRHELFILANVLEHYHPGHYGAILGKPNPADIEAEID